MNVQGNRLFSLMAKMRVFNVIHEELRLSWAFIRIDLTATIIPAMIFTLAALKHANPDSITEAGLLLLRSFSLFWLFAYTFCLCSQLVGIEEDRINKPGRPLPAGLVSVRGAKLRWLVTSVLYLAMGWAFGVMVWTALWVATSVLYCFAGWHKHWFMKNQVTTTIGVLAEISAAWQLVIPIPEHVWYWILVISISIGATANIQDLRDAAGDRAIGRKTLPVVVGDANARLFCVAAFAATSVAVYLLLKPSADDWKAYAWGIWLAGLTLVIILRILVYRTEAADHRTYLLYTSWYCSLLAGALVLL